MKLIQFLKSRTFFINLIAAIVLVAALLWGTMTFLSIYTDHGKFIVVPDFTGVKTNTLNKFIIGKNVRYKIIDSVYAVESPKGVVVKQEPGPKEHVKKNRTIYLYVTSVLPPQIEMPELKDKSLRQALSMIETYGLKLGKIKYVPDQCVNCVLKQTVDNKEIVAGKKIYKGTTIDLIVGKGLSDQQVNIPDLSGLTLPEAKSLLLKSSLTVGAVAFDGKDTLKARVYRQVPAFKKGTGIDMGSSVDVFLRTPGKTKTDTTDTK